MEKVFLNNLDHYLAYLAGRAEDYPDPTTYLEERLYQLCKKGPIGGVSPDTIKSLILEMIANGDLQVEAYDDTTIRNMIGTLNNLSTTDKTSLVNAINEVFTSVSNGKQLIASAITDKGVITSNTATFQTMANNIASITSGVGSTEEVLEDLLENRLMIWHDEFNGNCLDTTKWRYVYGTRQAGNVYKQYYPVDQSKLVYIEDNHLVMKALRNNPIPNYEWSASFIETNNLFEFKYGRIEAKIKFDTTRGLYATLWTLGANYDRTSEVDENKAGDETIGVRHPMCGEIDIAEWSTSKVSHTVHWGTEAQYNQTHPQGGEGKCMTTLDNEWHIYACEWTENKIEFFTDGVSTGSINLSSTALEDGYNAFKNPHFLMFNCGRAITGATEPNSNTKELYMLVDWVRVYAPSGVTATTEETSIALNKTSTTIAVGSEEILTATFTPDNTTDMTLNWSSSDPSVATCYGGKVIAKKEGSTTITVTSKNGKTATCNVTVGTQTTTTYTVTNNLTNVTNSNSANSVEENASYSATLTANSGYELSSVTVTMDGADLTSTVYSNGSINISSVTGNIVITANATQSGVTTYTVTNNLTNATNSNTATSVNENSSYNATISAVTGYTLNTVTVTMGGSDITSSAVSGGIITIGSVTGNIIITATTTASSGDNTLIYELGGILSDGSLEEKTTRARTNYIPVTSETLAVISGVYFHAIRCYDSSKNCIGSASGGLKTSQTATLTSGSAYVRLLLQLDNNDNPPEIGTNLEGKSVTVGGKSYKLQLGTIS